MLIRGLKLDVYLPALVQPASLESVLFKLVNAHILDTWHKSDPHGESFKTNTVYSALNIDSETAHTPV